MLTTPVIVGLGEVLWDLLPAGKQLGGAPANFAYHAHAQGAHAVVVSAVGSDPLGTELRARLDALGLDTSCLATDPAHPTSTVSVALDAAGTPTFTIHEHVAWDHLAWSPALAALAPRADAVCFGTLGQRSSPARVTIQRFVAATRPAALRIFDINFRQHYYSRETIAHGLANSQVLKLNDQELPVLAKVLALPGDEPAQLGALLKRYPLRLIALTRGAAGSTLFTPSERHDCAAATTVVVDSIGAGDAFTAALALGLLRDLPLAALHTHAAQLAAYVCTQPGATPPVPAHLRGA
jgi:fructokinase